MTPTTAFPRVPDAAIKTLIDSVHGNPIAMVNCARTLLMANDRLEEARALCREALSLDPHNAEARTMAQLLMSTGIGGWYFTMVQDTYRHNLYKKALQRVLVNGGTVLDIGAGTGIFAILAVQAGADHVIACERDPAVAYAANEIIKRNGYADKITLLPVDSRDLQVGRDLSELADVLLWDNLANDFLGAGCAGTLADAKARLVKAGAPVIPSRAELIACPVTDLAPEAHRMGIVDDIDMSAFNELSPTHLTLSPSKFELRSTPTTLFDIDVSGPDPITADRAHTPVTLTEGRVDGIAQWLRFHLTEGVTYETLGEDVHAFGAQFHLSPSFEATNGMTVELHGAHDTTTTWFWLER